MERVTFKFGDKYAVKCTDVNENTYYDKNFKNAESYYQGKAIDKLAHYENLAEKDLRKVLNNQPQVQPIVRNVEEIAAMLWRLDYYMRKQSKQDWIEWLTKKEV